MATRTPARKPSGISRVVAIDIGTDSVHAVDMSFAPDARIVKRGSARLGAPVWEDLAAHRDTLAQAIKTALSAGGISASQVVTAIPRRMATLKYARLPHAEPEVIRGMVEYEAQQYVPFPIEDVVLDHQIVSDEMDEMTTVMIVAARLTLVEALLSAFDKAGLEVAGISVSALALAEHARGTALPVALLEADGAELDMAVVNADKLLFSRAASLNGSRGVAVSPAEQLTAEISRSLAAYQNEHRSEPVTRVLIAGQGAELTEIQNALEGLIDIPVGPLTSPLLPAADPNASAYAVASGLGLQAAGGISTVDLVPASRHERKVQAKQRTNAVLALVGVAAVIVMAALYITNMFADQAKENAQAVVWNGKLDKAKTKLTSVKGDYDKVLRQYELTSGGLGRGKPIVDIMKAVSDSLPKGGSVYLTQLSFERGSALTIHGNAANETAATDLVIALQGSGAFKDVRLNYLGDNSVEIGGLPSGRNNPRQAAGTRGAAPGSAPPGSTKPAAPAGATPPRGGIAANTRGAQPGSAPGAAPPTGTGEALTASGKPAEGSMSFMVVCKVIGSEQKDLGEKTNKKTVTASAAGVNGERSNP